MNELFAPIGHKSYLAQFLHFIFIFGICFLFAQLLTTILLVATVGLETARQLNPVNLTGSQVSIYKFLQIVSSIFVFFIPALLFSYQKTGNRYRYFNLNANELTIRGIGLSIGIVLMSLPLIGFLLQLNQGLVLPSFLSGLEEWMRHTEEQLAELTAAFLKMDSPMDLLINLLMVAVLPAIGEELLFRGCLQKLLGEWWDNPHKAIWVTAIVFSFFHFQFFGFLPRMVLGLFLGYLFYWSGNLWYAIIGHFVNNGLQVILLYSGAMELDHSVENIPMLSVIVSTALLVYLGFHYYQTFNNNNRDKKFLS